MKKNKKPEDGKLTPERAAEYRHRLLEEFEYSDQIEGESFEYEDFNSAFMLKNFCSDFVGGEVTLIYNPSSLVIQRYLSDALDGSKFLETFCQNMSEEDRIEKLHGFREMKYAFFAQQFELHLWGIKKAFGQMIESFHQLNEILWNLYLRRVLAEAEIEHKNKKGRKFELSETKMKELFERAAKVYAERQKKNGKEIFDEAVSIIAPKFANKKLLFAEYYDEVIGQWQKAKKRYTKNRDFNWRKIIKDEFEELPKDLIERFEDKNNLLRSPN